MNKLRWLKTALMIAALVLIIALAIFANKLAQKDTPSVAERTFFTQFVISGGPIVWLILLPLSVITIHQGINYFLTIREKNLLPKNFGTDIIKCIRKNGYENLDTIMAQNNDIVSTAIARAVPHITTDRRQIQLQLQLQNVVNETIQEQCLKITRKIEMANIIGNVSPMIGLFGTVFGMIKLFNSIVIAGGQPRPEQMADGISIALVTTFWGLLVAIPALTLHCIFKNKIESIATEAVVEAEMIIVEIKKHIDNDTKIRAQRT